MFRYTFFKGLDIVENENYIMLWDRFSSMSDISFFENYVVISGKFLMRWFLQLTEYVLSVQYFIIIFLSLKGFLILFIYSLTFNQQ